AIGIGFYSGALIGTVLIYISLDLLSHIEEAIYRKAGNLALYIEVTDRPAFKEVMAVLKENSRAIEDIDFSRSSVITQEGIAFNVRLRLPRKKEVSSVVDSVNAVDGVMIVDVE
ncbi:MAG: hypothetical protein K6B12_00415, partial [Clostridiales bacterium]|nr:hypothetical protein [Clostridiales bacterium]